MAELHIDEPLDEGYWKSLGMQGDQARPGDPFSSPPPGAGSNPFKGPDGPTGRNTYEAGWLKTYGGVEFIDVFVGEAPGSDDTHMLVFLYESPTHPGRWAVGFSRPKTTEGGEFVHKDQDYESAKRLAEEEAMAMSVDAGAAADWRFAPSSGRQLALVERIFGEVIDDVPANRLSKGEASDKLNVHFASRTLDPTFAPRS